MSLTYEQAQREVDPAIHRCSFCHKTKDEVYSLVRCPSNIEPVVAICDICVDRVVEFNNNRMQDDDNRATAKLIVTELTKVLSQLIERAAKTTKRRGSK